jgi:hypothetical protein
MRQMSLVSGSLTGGREGVVADVRLDGWPAAVSFSGADDALRPWPDALVPLVLLPAMRTGSTAVIEGGVSPQLAAAVPMLQTLLAAWFPKALSKVDVEVLPEATPGDAGKTACFFTAGLDSFAEVLRRREEIDELVFVRGLDLEADAEGREESYRAVRGAATDLGLPLLEIETDLGEFLDPIVDSSQWGGAARATVALLLQHRYSRLLIAPDARGHDLLPWGSHPLLDPLWSTERLEFEPSGRGSTRSKHIARYGKSEILGRWLRVCHRPPAGEVNCGRCEKCLRTAVGLLAAGALEGCRTLPGEIDPEWVAALELTDNLHLFWEENLAALRASGAAPELEGVIERLLAPPNALVADGEPGQPAVVDPRSWAELERQAGLDLETVPGTGGRGRDALRSLALRLMRPHTSHARLVDRQLVEALQQLRAQLEAERVARRFLLRRVERLERERKAER